MPENDPYGNGTLVPSDHWGKGCPDDCETHVKDPIGERLMNRDVPDLTVDDVRKRFPQSGEWAEDFADILNRIPRGYGRWLDVGPGWYPLIAETHRKMLAIDPNYVVLQVKEKFGGLRYYHEVTTTEEDSRAAWDIERWAEEESFRTCESCGTKDGVTTEGSGWITSRCAACRDKPTQLGKF